MQNHHSMDAIEAFLRAHPQRDFIFNMPRARRPAPRAGEPLHDALLVIHDAAKALDDSAKAQRRSLTDAEEQAMASLLAQFNRIDGAIDDTPAPDLDALYAGRKTDPNDMVDMSVPVRNPRVSRPVNRQMGDAQPGAPEAQRVIQGTDSRAWNNMFPGAERDRAGWRGAGEFLAAMHSGRMDPRLVRDTAGQSEGIGADGGFFVPGVVLSGVMDAALELGVMRAGANVAPIASNAAMVPIWDFMDHTTGIGGFVGHWMGEGATADIQKGTARYLSMRACKLGIWSKITSELSEDSPTFVRDFMDALAKAVAFYEDLAYISGTGVGQPLGFINDPAYIQVAAESGQSADTVVYANLVNCIARLHPASFANSVWIASQTTLPQLLQLSVPVTAGQQHVPVLNEDNGQFRLLSRPLLFTEKAPVVGDVGDITLVDRSQYLIAMRREATFMTDIGAHWTTDEIGARMTMRVDARGKWQGPVTPKLGSTLSWAVGVEAR